MITDIFSLITLDFSQIDWQASYLLFSLVIACLVIYEAMMLYRYRGQLPEHSIVHIITLLDMVWFIISGIALYFIDFQPMAKIVPILFIIYIVFGWGYSSYLLKDQIDIQKIEKFEDIVIPKKFIDYSMSFGIGVLLAIIGVCCYLYQHQKLAISAIHMG